jgi:hypothetical protein
VGIARGPTFPAKPGKHDTERQTILTCPDLFAPEHGTMYVVLAQEVWAARKYGRPGNMIVLLCQVNIWKPARDRYDFLSCEPIEEIDLGERFSRCSYICLADTLYARLK